MPRHRTSINVSVRIPIEVYNALSDIAQATDATLSDVVREVFTFVTQTPSKYERIRARFPVDGERSAS